MVFKLFRQAGRRHPKYLVNSKLGKLFLSEWYGQFAIRLYKISFNISVSPPDGMFVLPALNEDLQPIFGLFPQRFDPSISIKGWRQQDFVMSRKGLACVLGHVEREGDETAAQNWNDRLEMMSTYPEEFLALGGGIILFLLLEEDNAHGSASRISRFCFLTLPEDPSSCKPQTGQATWLCCFFR